MRSGPAASYAWLALAGLLPAACDAGSPAPPPPIETAVPSPLVAASRPSVAPSSLPAPFSSVARLKAPTQREGETSVEALFDRARRAIVEGDDATLVHCLEPDARRRWLGDALLAIEIEVQIPRYEDQLGRRRALGALHDIVRMHVGRADAERPGSLSPDAVEGAILDRVKAPDTLLAELLGASRTLGHPLDPVGAAQDGRVGPAPDAAPTVGMPPPTAPQPAGLARALGRIQRAHDLAEVHLEDARGIALVRGTDGGLEPVRLVRRDDVVWIDES